MNKATRKDLENIIRDLDILIGKLESLKELEDSKLKNLPESLQQTDRNCCASNSVDSMQDALEHLDDCYDSLDLALNEVPE